MKPDPLKALGARLRELRKAKRESQSVFAKRCGLSQKYVSEIERGDKAPSWDTIVALAHRGLDVPLAALVRTIDDDVIREPQRISDVVAGRSPQAHSRLVEAFELLLRKPG